MTQEASPEREGIGEIPQLALFLEEVAVLFQERLRPANYVEEALRRKALLTGLSEAETEAEFVQALLAEPVRAMREIGDLLSGAFDDQGRAKLIGLAATLRAQARAEGVPELRRQLLEAEASACEAAAAAPPRVVQ